MQSVYCIYIIMAVIYQMHTIIPPQFVEVKGPGDRLVSHKQIIWLSRLANWSCDVEVCLVAAKRKIL